MINLKKAFEVENGIKVGDTIIPDSVLGKTRSAKPTYTGDFITSMEYYNSLTQVNANRIAKSDFTYTNDFVSTQTNTYYETNGVTVHQVESLVYVYSGDNLLRVEVT